MTSRSALLHAACWSISLLCHLPANAEARCSRGPAGPHDVRYLTDCRPEPVTRAQRDAFVRTLPPGGALTAFTPIQRARIDALATIVRFHGRESVYEIRIVDVPQAWAGLYGRAVLLISLPALNLLESRELQAFVAHEIGHEYLWAEWQEAHLAGDHARLRQIEAGCDAIALLTLAGLELPVAPLAAAIEKVERYNRTHFGVPLNAGSYPSAKDRRRHLARFSARRSVD
jgi:hypothetical protein